MLLALIRLEVLELRGLRVYIDVTGPRLTAWLIGCLTGGASWQLPIITTRLKGHRRNERHADRVTATSATDPNLATYLDACGRPVETASALQSRPHPPLRRTCLRTARPLARLP